MSDRFPFSAIVGQEDAKLALLLNVIDPHIGGVLLRGDKGSAKSTLVRGLTGLLGPGTPFVELPIGATEDRVVGTIDIESVLTAGRRRFHAGLLASADGGVLYVDEVNLLPDHLVDVLLDVAASGVNRVEREGVSEEHPARFVLTGSMNPEEGELRPQLLDRFGLSVDVSLGSDPLDRAEAVRRRLEYDTDPEKFRAGWRPADDELAARLADVVPAALPDGLISAVSRLCTDVGAQGLRADLVICRAAAALAGWEGRGEATFDDVRRVAALALSHRRRRGPFDDPGLDQETIGSALDQAEQSASAGDPGEPPGPEEREEDIGPRSPRERPPVTSAPPQRVVEISAPRSGLSAEPTGRRSKAYGSRGRLVGERLQEGRVTSLAVAPTVRAAAARRLEDEGGPLVTTADLREAVREQRVANLLVLAVDASASMGVERRMEAVKGAVLSLLLDAYQRRDRVSLVVFRAEEARVVLRPTGSVEVARRRLGEIPTGGRTPLAAGIRSALGVATTGGGGYRPLLVLVSDGRATWAAEGADAFDAALTAADEVRKRSVPAVVLDVDDGDGGLGLTAEIAERMGARHLTLPELSAGALTDTLRGVLGR